LGTGAWEFVPHFRLIQSCLRLYKEFYIKLGILRKTKGSRKVTHRSFFVSEDITQNQQHQIGWSGSDKFDWLMLPEVKDRFKCELQQNGNLISSINPEVDAG